MPFFKRGKRTNRTRMASTTNAPAPHSSSFFSGAIGLGPVSASATLSASVVGVCAGRITWRCPAAETVTVTRCTGGS
jgi:hypothetical protein